MDVTDIIAELTSTWYYQVPFRRDNPKLAPAVDAYLAGGNRPANSLIEQPVGVNHYAKGLVLLEDLRRELSV